jgi:hypothetical protein
MQSIEEMEAVVEEPDATMEEALAAFEAEKVRAEEAGLCICDSLTELAGEGCPPLRPVYGSVMWVGQFEAEDAYLLVDQGPASDICRLAVPNWLNLTRDLLNTVETTRGDRLFIISPTSHPSRAYDGVLVAMCTTDLCGPGRLVEIVTCGGAYDIGEDRWPAPIHLVKWW